MSVVAPPPSLATFTTAPAPSCMAPLLTSSVSSSSSSSSNSFDDCSGISRSGSSGRRRAGGEPTQYLSLSSQSSSSSSFSSRDVAFRATTVATVATAAASTTTTAPTATALSSPLSHESVAGISIIAATNNNNNGGGDNSDRLMELLSSSNSGSDYSSCDTCECESPIGSDFSDSSEPDERSGVVVWDPARLANQMQQLQPGDVLPIDVRPADKYNSGHISGAVSAVCSGLHVRRLKSGTLPVENVVCPKQRKTFRETKERATIVVYDQSSDSLSLEDSSPLAVICARLASEGAKVVFLRGGFAEFAAQFPSEVETTALPAPIAFRGLLDCNANNKISSPPPSANPASCLQAPLTKVQDYLYLGSQFDARNEVLLAAHGIRYVLNVTLDCPNYFESKSGFRYKQICIKDAWHQNIAEYFQSAFEFIEEARSAGVSVLVHCAAGISRSATIVLAYMMKKKHCSLNAAFSELKGLRSSISPNLDFMGHLLQYQKALGIKADSGYDSPAYGSELSPMVVVEAKAGDGHVHHTQQQQQAKKSNDAHMVAME